jgi:cobalamin biosynthesis protein CobT
MNEFSKSEEDASEATADDDDIEQEGAEEQDDAAGQLSEPEPDVEEHAEREDEVPAGDEDDVDPPAAHVEQPDAEANETANEQRRSARLVAGARRPMRYRSFHTSVRKGLKEHGADAYKAIVAELKQLLSEKKAIKPVHREDLSARQLKRSIRSLMFLKTKFDGLGRFEKIKARLVANGKQQDRELYPDTYSPTVACSQC